MHLAAVSLLLLCGPPLSGSETAYLIRIETIGYVDADVTEKVDEPEEAPLRTVETVCRLDEPFLARVVIGSATTTISGVLRRAHDADSDFSINLECSHVVDTGKSVLIGPGSEQRILDKQFVRSTLVIREGSAFEAGSLHTSSTDLNATSHDSTTTKSKSTVSVTVEKYRP